MSLRPLSYRKVAKRLENLDFNPVRQSGSQVIFKHTDGRMTVVPNHPGEKIGRYEIRNFSDTGDVCGIFSLFY